MRKKVTATELMAHLNSDPEFLARRTQAEEQRQARTAKLRKAEAPLVNELQHAGYDVDSAWDLVNSTEPYLEALPILLDHLSNPYPGPVLEGIARALAVPEARFAWPVLVNRYREEQDPRAKAGMAVAIAATAEDSVLEELINLVTERSNGSSRVLLLSALERSKNPRGIATLVELQNDPDLKKEIRVILQRLPQARR